MIAQSTGLNATGKSAGFQGDGFKLGGGRCIVGVICSAQDPSWLGGVQAGQGKVFGFNYSPGGIVDRFVETYAGPHDFLNSGYHYTPDGFAKNFSGSPLQYGFGEVLNGLNVAVATPFAAASVIPSSAYPVFLKY